MARYGAFDKHLFISYAHLDNRPMSEEQQGWVTRFHSSLEMMLSMRLGRKAEIWRDKKLAGNDVFAAEILAQFSRTALLVSVLTPRYVESAWCAREVREFCKAAEQSGGLVADNKARVIKVIKTPVDAEDSLPPVMKEVLGYPFYILDGEQTPLELDPVYGPEISQQYHLKVAKLAWDLAQQLKKLESGAASVDSPAPPASMKPTVYLAECSWDQRQARESLEADLRMHGYPVLPEHPLPRDEAGYVAEAARLLEQAKLSIHLVGAGPGAVPDGPSGKSVVALQNELAIERSRKAGLRRVIWLPAGTDSSHAEQQRFIEALSTEAALQCGADLLDSDLETLKGAIHSALRKIETPAPPVSGSDSATASQPFVYLICDERDRKATLPLRKFLRSQDLEVRIPLFEGDAATVRKANQDLLAQCDAVIVFYGIGLETWKHSVDSELRKMNGYRSGKPLMASYTYLAEPATPEKEELLELEEPNLIRGLNGFSESEMEPVLQACRKRTVS